MSAAQKNALLYEIKQATRSGILPQELGRPLAMQLIPAPEFEPLEGEFF